MANWPGVLLLLIVYGLIFGIQSDIDPYAYILLAALGGVAFVVSE